MIALGIGVATVAAFIVSSVYYGVLPAAPVTAGAAPASPDAAPGASPGAASGRPAPWQIAAELVRSAITAGLVAGLLHVGGWDGAAAGALLGLALWALPFVLLTGSVVWEGVPVRRAALHTGDWLVKLVAVGALVGAIS